MLILLTKMSPLEIGILIAFALILTIILINMIVKKFSKKKKPKKNDDEEEIKDTKK